MSLLNQRWINMLMSTKLYFLFRREDKEGILILYVVFTLAVKTAFLMLLKYISQARKNK